jgi:hypothetical protein
MNGAFKTIYYAGEDDDQQRVSTINRDSAYFVEFDDYNRQYIRVGVLSVDEEGEELPETIISLEVGENRNLRKEPLDWFGNIDELKALLVSATLGKQTMD